MQYILEVESEFTVAKQQHHPVWKCVFIALSVLIFPSSILIPCAKHVTTSQIVF